MAFLAFLVSVPGYAANLVGTSAGTFTVGATGGASYSVPITVPPGASGMEPKLSLSYDSSSGDGLIGQGFAVHGFSQITRCQETLDQDGVIRPINFDSNDRYCLDGQRFVAVQGTYGDVGTEYRTEIESFSKIVSSGGTTGDPDHFVVQTKSGLIYEYGTSADSRFEPPGSGNKALTWAVRTIRDTTGNYMTFSYQEDTTTGEFYPTTISYTGNTTAGVAPYNSVSFVWVSKPNPIQKYVGGAKTFPSKNISVIRTYSGASLVREYRLSYTTSISTGKALLSSVQECAGTSRCFPATTFAWSTTTQTNPGFTGAGSGNWQGHTAGTAKNLVTDIDGDGQFDSIGNQGTGINFQWKACLSRQTNFSCFDVPANNTFDIELGISGDYTGDGLTDLVAIDREPAEPPTIPAEYAMIVNRSQGTSFSSGSNFSGFRVGTLRELHTGDFNGDGRADVAAIIRSTSGSNTVETRMIHYSTGTSFTTSSYGTSPAEIWGSPVEIDGDGRTDFISISGNGHFSACAAANNFVCADWGGPGISGGETPVLGDFNGDGLVDAAAYAGGGNWSICLSTGKSFAPCVTEAAHSGGSSNNLVGDFNGDGLSDLASQISGTSWNVCINKGTSFACSTRTGPNFPTTSSYAADINGDGLSDLVSDAGSGTWSVNLASEPKPDLLVGIVNGLGALTGINYSRLSDSTFYTRPTDFTYPVRGIATAIYVVSSSTQTDGVGGTRQVSYTYEGGRVHLRGRGFLGFSKKTVFDQNTRLREITQYRQDFPFIGSVISVRTETEAGAPVSTSDVTYSEQVIGSGTATRHFPFVSQSTERKYEIAPFAGLVTTTVTANTYGDSYGNLTASTVNIYEGDGSNGLVYSTSTSNTYNNDAGNWLLGRLLQTQVTKQIPNQAAQTRTSSFEYSAGTGLLSAETVQPGTALELRTEYQRDAFGNIISTTVSGPDIASRTTLGEFSTGSPYYGRFKTRSTNPLGHFQAQTFDPATGNVLSVSDPNGLVTNYQYDDLGRKSGETFNNAGISKSATVERLLCSQISFCGGGQDVLAIHSFDNAGAESYVVYDILERETRKVVLSPNGYVATLTQYDAKGRVFRKSSPKFLTSSNTYWTTYSYDLVGRTIQENAPIDKNNASGRITRTEYSGLTNRIYDPLNHLTTRVMNPLGELVQVTDALNGQITNTYDSYGNLIATTDAGGAVTSLAYDIRGRKTGMNDPSMGQWYYQYDTLGELVRQQDAKNQVVTMTYDLLGRMVGRTETEGTSTWTYDTLWKGALTEVNTPDYRRAYAYYPHGGVQQESISIASTNPPAGTVSIDGFAASPPTFSEGNSTTITWVTSNAVACTGTGTLPGWSGTKSVNGNQVVRVNSAGSYQANLICSDAVGGATTGSITVTVQSSPTVIITSFSASPATINERESTTLSWNSNNAVFCQGSGTLPGWAGLKAISGSQVLAESASGNYQATLTCTDIADRTASRTVQVKVNHCLTPLLVCVNQPVIPPVGPVDLFELPGPSLLNNSGEFWTPPVDLDGSFTVYWSAWNQLLNLGEAETLNYYKLEIATDPNFTSSHIAYQGFERSFRFVGLPRGAYFIRVSANIKPCTGPFHTVCDNPPEDTPYFIGPKGTIVGGIQNDPTWNPSSTSSSSDNSSSPNSQSSQRVQPKSQLSGSFLEYDYTYTYDSLGRVNQIAYPSGFKVAQSYNSVGALNKVFDPNDPSIPYWQGQHWSEWGSVDQSHLRNGIDTLKSYDPAVSRIAAITSGLSGGSSVQSLSYGWDHVGNLTLRQDNNQGGLHEDFEYDELYRLKRSTLTGVGAPLENLALTYAANGNILTKTGVGNYTYDPQHPQAVTAAGGWTFSYDANGNMVSGADRTYTWASYNLPTHIGQSARSSEFLYGPERQRTRQLSMDSSYGDLIYYAGSLYEEHRRGTTIEQKHFINTPDGVAAIQTNWSSGAKRTDYLHRDHLGSVDTITDGNGLVVERLSYDAFGKRRGTNWQGEPSQTTFKTSRGFTGHEHLDGLGLIHMNGRVYDPVLGRFISADSVIQAPESTQSHNRYSYVMNNPLTLTDPSGHFWNQIIGAVLAIVGKIIDQPALTQIGIALATYGASSFGQAAAFGFAGALFSSDGDLKSALISGATAGLFYGIGSSYQAFASVHGGVTVGDQISKAVMHGLVGGFSSVAQGGNFRSGFLSAAVPEAAFQFTPDGWKPSSTDVVGNTAYSSVLGGTASALGGGKFANGAVTGAFGYLFNDAVHPGWHDYTEGPNQVCAAALACSSAEMVDQMSRFAVPGQDPGVPVVNNGIYGVSDPRTGMYAGQVRTNVSADGLTVTNTTLPGHIFYDGQIVRSASEAGGAWYVTTHGFGNNVIPGAATINQWQGPKIFNYLDQQMRMNIERHH